MRESWQSTSKQNTIKSLRYQIFSTRRLSRLPGSCGTWYVSRLSYRLVTWVWNLSHSRSQLACIPDPKAPCPIWHTHNWGLLGNFGPSAFFQHYQYIFDDQWRPIRHGNSTPSPCSDSKREVRFLPCYLNMCRERKRNFSVGKPFYSNFPAIMSICKTTLLSISGRQFHLH